MIGEVKMFAGNFAPRGWAKLDGQLLPISSNTALFSILGTQFGGDGRTTFALPDMRGRSAIGVGQGPGLRPFFIGERVGAESAQLLQSNMPIQAGNAHLTQLVDTGETVQAGKARGNGAVVEIPVLEETQVLVPFQMNGGSVPVNIRQPSLGLTHIICLVGYFPSRS
ncbi:MAG: phage tail protein [Deltaproteobacteria bacterium]|nr:MAG: phage tail protein [Deltaproteobacteria bacterium]TNF30731.1 MAG: phage tail protein [Deltaproteobacteria bacterium]